MLVGFLLSRRVDPFDRAPQIHVDAGCVEYVIDDARTPGTCVIHVAGREGIVVLGTADEAARKINEALTPAAPRPDSWVSTK